jgi:hypothetical protein
MNRMNQATRAKLAYMRMTILDLQPRTPRPRDRPGPVPLELLRALYHHSLNDATRAYLQQLKRKGREPWKLQH